jgi:putative flippase GtrA
MHLFRKLADFANVYSTGLLAYLAVACLSAATEWGSFAIGVLIVPPIAAALVGFLVATSVNFVLSRCLVFRSQSWWVSELGRLFMVSAAVFAWNLLVFYALYQFADVPLMAAKIIGTIAGFALNFSARQFWVFSVRPRYAPISSRKFWASGE